MNDKVELFENTPVPKAIAKLTVPTICGSLVMVLYNLADTYFVGMINDPLQNAAVALAGPVLLAFNAINNLFGIGTSSMMSRALGTKDYDLVRRSSAFGFYCSLFSGIIFLLACTFFKVPLLTLLGADAVTMQATSEYMFWAVTCGAIPAILNVVMSYMVRAEGGALHASIGAMSGCVLNIILDPIFILPWGLGMGAAGAGLATFLSNCVSLLYFLVLTFRKKDKTYVCVDIRKFTLRKDVVVGVCGVGIPACIQNLLNVTGMTILNNFTSAYGADAVAAMGIAQKISMVPLQVAMGFSQGIMPLVSYTYASKHYRRMKDTILFAIKVMMPALAVVAAACIIGSEFLIGAFMDNETIVAYGSKFLQGHSIGVALLCMDFLVVGVFQAQGNGKAALVFAILRKIVLEIPALFVLNKLFPLYGLAYAQPFAEFVLSVAAVIMLKRIFDRCKEEKEFVRTK